MQKTIQDNSREYRLVTDGRRWKVQYKFPPFFTDWEDVFTYSWEWMARLDIWLKRRKEAARRRDRQAIWEVKK